MIFQHTLEEVLSGKKTQTRRLVHPLHYTRLNGGRATVMRAVNATPDELAAWLEHRRKNVCSACDGYGGIYFPRGGFSMICGRCGGRGTKTECVPPFETRVQWEIGRTYAVQPGRGKPAVARIRITNIRQERLCDITAADARAEGFSGIRCPNCDGMGVDIDKLENGGIDPTCLMCRGTGFAEGSELINFMLAWDEIHKRKGTRVMDNPRVWVLEFKLEEVP